MANNLKTSDNGIKLIKDFEGERLIVYDDGFGYPTVGCGHRCLPSEGYRLGQKITQAESTSLLRHDLGKAEHAVNTLVKVSLNQNQFDALAAFAFNCGTGALQKSHLLAYLNKGNFQAASDEFRKYVKSGGSVVAGLVRRRKAERQLFLTPSSANPPDASKAQPAQQAATNPNHKESAAALVTQKVVQPENWGAVSNQAAADQSHGGKDL